MQLTPKTVQRSQQELATSFDGQQHGQLRQVDLRSGQGLGPYAAKDQPALQPSVAGNIAGGAGQWARKTTIETQNDGSVRRRVTMASGKVIKDEVLMGARWALLSARTRSGMSQADFAHAIGVSKRTLENWEQGRVEPSGPAKILLNLVAKYPDTVKRLSKILPDQQLTA